jgi:ligand-binding sensor domain-containing protein
MRRILGFIPLILLLLTGSSQGDGVWKYFINGNNINDISVQGDYIWCATTAQPVRWNKRDSTYTCYPDNGHLIWNHNFTAADHKGNTWFGYTIRDSFNVSGTFSVKRYDGSNFKTFSASETGLEGATITSMLCDYKDTFWLGSSTGIVWYDGTSWSKKTSRDIFTGIARSLAMGNDGRLWIASDDGLYSFDRNAWTHYTTADGLADNAVRQILFDSDGKMWLATMGGVTSFDGKIFKSYHVSDGLASDNVNAVEVDKNGRKWFATENGVSCFDGNGWISYREIDGLISSKVSGVTVDSDNRIWLCHKNFDKGVTCLNGKEVTWYTIWNSKIPSNHVESIACDRDGILWFATDKGVARYDGSSWKLFTTIDGLAQNQVSGIYVDDQNGKWFVYNSNFSSGVTRFDGTSWKTYTTEDGLRNNVVRSVTKDADGSVWLGINGGVELFDGHSWKAFPGNDGLFSLNIFSIAEGPNGILWFATDKGLSRFDGKSWSTYNHDDGLSYDNLKSVAVSDRGEVWCLTDQGDIFSFDGIVFRNISFQAEGIAYKPNISHIAVDRNGALWTDVQNRKVDGFQYLYWFDGKIWNATPFQKAKNYPTVIRKIAVDRDNVKWIATDGGLIALDGNSCRQFFVEGFNFNVLKLNYALVDQENTIWFSGYPNELLYVPQNWEGYSYNSLPANYITENSPKAVDRENGIWYTSGGILYLYKNKKTYSYAIPSTTTVNAIAIDQENVKWLATFNGVFSFDGVSWKQYQKSDGLASNYVPSVAVDQKSVKWFGTNLGISSFDGSSWKTYTQVDGIGLSIALTNQSIAVDRNDVKWFCGYTFSVVSFDGREWKNHYSGWPLNSSPYQVAVDHNNVKWFFSGNTAVSFDNLNWKVYSQKEGMLSDTPQSLVIDKSDNKWFIGSNSISILDDRPGAGSDVKPRPFTLLGNYPNPFNSQTVIEFDLYSFGTAKLAIYNLAGQKIRELGEGNYPAGTNSVVWDGRDGNGVKASSGIYFYQLINDGRAETKKMMFLK